MAQQISLIPSTDGRVVHAAWQHSAKPERWIVSLHGTGGSAVTDVGIWHKHIGGRPIGVLAIQWWLGEADAYLLPLEIYREIDVTARKLGIEPGHAMLHGFSRGAANLYAVAAIDAGRGRKLFSIYVASSGGVAYDYPPTRAILEGRFGARPLAKTRWITACGGLDPNPDRDGCGGMRHTGDWLKNQGAVLILAIEDWESGHGALQRNPRNAARVLDLLMK